MSTFLGLIEEIPGISIDCFDMENLNSSAFFLSHCHQDHMKGLDYSFFNHLKYKNKYLYCSNISKLILVNIFYKLDTNFIDNYLIVLPLNEARIINYEYNGILISISIACISSGHCPGSIMFLFTFNDKKILYTGDFRINEEDFSKLKSLHHSNTKQTIPLYIDKIYIDTTFLNLDFQVLPNRSDSVKVLCEAVKDWIEKDPRNVVVLEISALYGSEFIYIELSKILNKKIHVKDKVFNVYSRVEMLANCITNIGENTSIHACMNKIDSSKNTFTLKCTPNVDQKNILTIIPSVQKWARKNTSSIIEWDSIRQQTKNVCYSTHASYNEIAAFIRYFKPKEVFACVCPEKDRDKIYKLLKDIMQEFENNKLSKETKTLNFSNYKTFEVSNFKSIIISDDEDDI